MKKTESGHHANMKTNPTDLNEQLLQATQRGDKENVLNLLQQGAEINVRDAQGRTPRLAIDAHADTRLTNRFGGISIIPASERGHVEIVRELLTHTSINVNHVNNLGWTALLEAIILSNGDKPHQQIVQLLIDHGADVNLADRDGVTPLHHARERRFTEIEHILLLAGAH